MATGNDKVDYKAYLASREWRLKRKEVINAHGNECERCGCAPIENVHHVTYAAIGREDPYDDLMGLCRPRHEFLSAESERDPALEAFKRLISDEEREHGKELPVITAFNGSGPVMIDLGDGYALDLFAAGRDTVMKHDLLRVPLGWGDIVGVFYRPFEH